MLGVDGCGELGGSCCCCDRGSGCEEVEADDPLLIVALFSDSDNGCGEVGDTDAPTAAAGPSVPEWLSLLPTRTIPTLLPRLGPLPTPLLLP